MPNLIWQQQKSTHDIDTYRHLNSSKNNFVDWESVTLFYAALHLIDAYLVGVHNIQSRDHYQRNNNVRTWPISIRNAYISLYNLSRKARYMAPVSQQERDRAKVHFNSISTFLKAGLSV